MVAYSTTDDEAPVIDIWGVRISSPWPEVAVPDRVPLKGHIDA